MNVRTGRTIVKPAWQIVCISLLEGVYSSIYQFLEIWPPGTPYTEHKLCLEKQEYFHARTVLALSVPGDGRIVLLRQLNRTRRQERVAGDEA